MKIKKSKTIKKSESITASKYTSLEDYIDRLIDGIYGEYKSRFSDNIKIDIIKGTNALNINIKSNQKEADIEIPYQDIFFTDEKLDLDIDKYTEIAYNTLQESRSSLWGIH